MCVYLTLIRLLAPAVLRTIVSLLVAAWWCGVAVLSSATMVSVLTVTERREQHQNNTL